MSKVLPIYCCGCEREVEAQLVYGDTVYEGRRDLCRVPFWRCGTCGNFVGCHHKTRCKTRPLGVIATPAVKSIRRRIHDRLDPIWKSSRIDRNRLYGMVAERLGIEEYHTAEIRSVEEGERVLAVVKQISRELIPQIN